MHSPRAKQALIERISGCLLKNGNFSFDDCRLILADAYEVIESEGSETAYKTIVFYRNWLFHYKLERGKAKRFIKELDALFRPSEEHLGQLVIDYHGINLSDFAADHLSTKSLRHELKMFLNSIGCNCSFLDSYNFWTQFIGTLANWLVGKPLLIKDSKFVEKFFLSTEGKNIVLEVKLKNSPVGLKMNFCMDEFRKDFSRE